MRKEREKRKEKGKKRETIALKDDGDNDDRQLRLRRSGAEVAEQLQKSSHEAR